MSKLHHICFFIATFSILQVILAASSSPNVILQHHHRSRSDRKLSSPNKNEERLAIVSDEFGFSKRNRERWKQNNDDPNITFTTMYVQPIYYDNGTTGVFQGGTNFSLSMFRNDDELQHNCTDIHTPCRSIAEAMNNLLFLFRKGVIQQLAGRLILMKPIIFSSTEGSSNNATNNSSTYREDQCEISNEDMLFHLILQPFNDRIAIDCQHSALFKDQAFALLIFENIDVKKSYWKVSYSTLDIQYMTIKNSIWEENIVEIDDLSELPQVWIDIQYSTQRRSVFTLAAKPSIFISHSLLEKITFNSLRNSNISISCSQVIDSNFGNSKDLHEVWDNVEFTIEDSSILNSNVTLARFRHVTFHNVSFHETNMLAIIYTYDVLFQNVIAREGRFYSLLQSNGNLNIWESVFDSLDSIENFKHLFDIISTSPIDIDSSLFSNNKAPVMHLLDILAANIYYSNFLDNIGPCLAAEWNTFLVGSFIRIESVNFINNTCTDCEGSAAQLNFDSIEIVESYFQGNQALNGGALRINSAESQISKSVFLDNIASYKGGAIYIPDFTAVEIIDLNENIYRNNTAFYAGGSCYFGKFDPSILQEFQLSSMMVNNEFISNQGKAYGKDIGYSLYRISYEMTIYYSMENVTTYISNQTSLRSPQLYMYPGQHIPTIEFKLWNNGTERVLFVATSPVFQLEDHSVAFISYNNSASSNTRNFIGFKSFAISLYELDRDSIRGNIYLTASEIIEVWIHILPCPPDTRLHMNGNPVGTYSCISVPYIPYAIVISVASIVSILFFSLFLIAVNGIFRIYRNIFRRLKRLESKENAEKRIETKLLEKRVVLMENGYTSNLVEHPTESTSLLINSTVERKRKSSFSSQQSSWIISIDEIEILKRLAEGASGTVYLASWNGTQVALKSWKNTMSSSDHEVANDHHEQEFEEGFEKEAALLGSIRHPNVIQFYGVVVANPTRKYIVVEYLEKGSLDKLIYNSKLGIEKLSLRQKIDILLGVARGMNYLHSHAIIHRDLKPGNILIDKNYMAKICDFGLSLE